MDTFCTAMNKTQFFPNEKYCNSYSINNMNDNDDLGLVALDTQSIGNRGSKKNLTKCGINDNTLYLLYNNIIDKINLLDNTDKKLYIKYLLKLLFKIRDIQEGNGERDIFYKLIIKLYEIQPELVKFSLVYLVGGYDFNNDNNKFDIAPPGSFLDLNNIYKLCFEQNKMLSNNKYIYNNKFLITNNEKLMDFILDLYKNTILYDSYNDSYPTLASKWAPRENSSLNKKYNMAHKLTLKTFNKNTPAELKKYRKLLNNNTEKLSILEKYMCANEWDNIEVKNIPSKALMKYMKALQYINKDGTIRTPSKEDRLRLRQRILEELNKSKINPSESKINTKTLMPYEMVAPIINNVYCDYNFYNSLWNQYVYDFKNNLSSSIKPGLCIADVSGSMHGLPLEVCISLSLLLSELIESPLKNKVITFSENPTWHTITGNTLQEKVSNLKSADWGGNTNFGKVMDLILNTAIKNKLTKEQLPDTLYVFSDMQWDQATGNNTYNYYKSYTQDKFLTGFDSIQKAYSDAGYTMPHIVFWNLRATNNFNNKSNQKGTTMMSGFSSNMFKAFLEGTFIPENTPWDTLKDILNSSRYSYLDTIFDKYYQ